MVGFSSDSLFPTRKQEGFTLGGTRGIDQLMQRRTQGAGIKKKLGGQVRPRMHSRFIHKKQEKYECTPSDSPTPYICLRKRDLDVRQARRTVQDKSEWWGFVRGNACGIAQEMNPRP